MLSGGRTLQSGGGRGDVDGFGGDGAKKVQNYPDGSFDSLLVDKLWISLK